MYIYASVFLKVDKFVFKARNQPLNMHLSFFFSQKSNDHLYLYIRNLENSRSKPFFWYTISICRQKILNGYRVVEK